jgi:hypothetical protein
MRTLARTPRKPDADHAYARLMGRAMELEAHDRQTVVSLYHSYSAPIAGYLEMATGDATVAEDLLMDVFMDAAVAEEDDAPSGLPGGTCLLELARERALSHPSHGVDCLLDLEAGLAQAGSCSRRPAPRQRQRRMRRLPMLALRLH